MVIALTTVKGVIAKPAIEGVMTGNADQGVMASFSCDRVVVRTASCGVITSPAGEVLRSCLLVEIGQDTVDECSIKGKT